MNKPASNWYPQRCRAMCVVLAILTMTGCLSLAPVEEPAQDADQVWRARSDYLYQQDHWTAHLTLIGVTDEQKFKTRAHWEQRGDHYTIKLRDFIGRTVAIIEGSPAGVQAKTSKGQQFQGDSAEQLIEQLFAIQIPVTGMRYWLLGVPLPQTKVSQLEVNQQGLAEQLKQQGWEMHYPRYTQQQPYAMPAQVVLDYDDIDLTVKVSRWVVGTE